MHKVSIVIVNYNVRYFLRQCLHSIASSNYSDGIEVIVVDNDSKDGSKAMLDEEFPDVIKIYNDKNVGFGTANNQGFEVATGHYVLILNPDTIIQEDTIELCHAFMQANKNAGALTVKMIDGTGKYLPESKRGFPTIRNSLFKLTGLAKLFPNSSFFNGYYLGHIDSVKAHPVDVLPGAFVFTTKEVLDKIVGFDEDYFMYGEDIELSYQIQKTGVENYYIPTTSIVHFKGESTKKASLSYLKNFYGAMKIYANKRGHSSTIGWSILLNLGIILSALLSVVKGTSKRLLRPIFDMALLFGLVKLLQKLWAVLYHNNLSYYADFKNNIVIVALVAAAIFCYYLFGQYDKRHNIKHLVYGFVISTFGILSIYSLLPEAYRFSRVIFVAMALSAPVLLYITRSLFNGFLYKRFAFNTSTGSRIAMIGTMESRDQIEKIMTSFSETKLIGRVYDEKGAQVIGRISEIGDIVKSWNINELIFCSKDVASKTIFEIMALLGNRIIYRVANNDNTSILGSDSKERIGEWHSVDIGFKINQPFHIRTKRLLDLMFCFFTILFFPIVLLLSNRKAIYSNILDVIFARKTWIGYHESDTNIQEVPKLRSGIFPPLSKLRNNNVHKINLRYARSYSTWNEVAMLSYYLFNKYK